LICYRGRFGDMLTRLENRLKKERAARKPLVDANFFGNWNRDKDGYCRKTAKNSALALLSHI